jgi:Domain of unknown function (DUF4291)
MDSAPNLLLHEGAHEVRATFDSKSIRVYQAFSDEIADAALRTGTFVPPFSLDRMTWIKPSFLWMMYRSGWGAKERGQSRVLAIDISRLGFEWALEHGISTRAKSVEGSVLIQWDPERDFRLERMSYKTIQIGLRGDAIKLYVKEWIVNISDMTNQVAEMREHYQAARFELLRNLLPKEASYPIHAEIHKRLCL